LFDRIAAGRTDLVLDLLNQGVAATAQGPDGVPLIRWCAYYGDVSAVRLLLERGERLSALGPNFDLNGAAFHGHWRLCEFLIEQGADPNATLPGTGESPLHAAITKAGRPGQELVLAVLLRAGARPNVHTSPGAATGGFMRDARTRGETPLHRAAAFGSEAEIGMLLKAGAELDARDAHGDSPLSWASWHLRPPAILRLLCYGEHRINPAARAAGDHGAGWSGMEISLLGTPLGRGAEEPSSG
jgi:ankyrin repeat protein